MLQISQIADFYPHFFQFCLYKFADFLACIKSVLAQIQNLPDFPQRETETLHLADKLQACDIAIRVKAEVAGRSGRLWEQGVALVEADRINAQIRLLRHISDVHGMAIRRHIESIHSGE